MNELEIDYSQIQEAPPVVKSSWRPPRHVFFGKKNPEDGTMEEEPIYTHQEFPRMMYRMENDKIAAFIVNNSTELTLALSKGAKKNPSAFGYLTAPSFEQVTEMRAKAAAKDLEKNEQSAGGKKWRDMNAEERAAFQAAKAQEAA